MFTNLNSLNWGKQVIIHAFGQKYIYEVRTMETLAKTDLSTVINKQEELTWLTLITCRVYDEKSDTYLWRTVVRAVLMSVEEE